MADARSERHPAVRGSQVEERRRRGTLTFIRDSWAELKKVEWPGQNQVIQGTVVVLVACIIVGVYLWGCDQAFRRLVQQVFLGQ